MNEEDIKLFPHNEVAYKKLVASLDEYPLSFIEHATGTGKSFIILKYLYAKMREKRIFFVSLHDEMFDQLFGKQMKTLGMKRSDFKKFETLIYHNLVKQDPKELVDQYDCFVFDEAHHCGAPKWSKIVKGIKEEVLKRKDKKMIGLTATGIRYLDDYLDVAEEYFDGHVASRLNVAESMLKALLPAPLYINSIISCKDKYDRVMHKLKKLPRTKEINDVLERMNEIGKNIEDNSSIPELLMKYDVKPGEKYIVFCSSIKDLKQKKQEAESWFKDIGKVKMFEAHSAQKKEKNRDEINEFEQKRDEISLMFAVDIFNEGFHIDDLDGILMFRKTKSPIVYLQQIGRALSFSARKKQIKIFDFVDNISDNDVIRELYKELVSEAKRLVREEPENKEIFESIIKRFEIVDYTSSTIETLDEINAYLDENFTFRNSIIRAIGLLQQYRDQYPNNDIQYDIKSGSLDQDYLRAYNHIIAMDKYLTLANIEVLNNLKIDFNGEIITDLDKRRKLLGGHESYNEQEAAEFNNFKRDYIDFTNINNRRPKLGNSKDEDELYLKYREYLGKLSKKQLMSLLNKFNFKLTVEETILTGNYPNKDDLYDYFKEMVKKLGDGTGFDRVELKVLKKLKSLIPLEFYQLKDYIDHSKDINSIMDDAIDILIRDERTRLQNLNNEYISLVKPRDVIKARKILTKYALHVTNEQFRKLLEFKIELPRAIDMSLEERLEKLGKYDSFYEKEVDAETSVVANYFNFIVKNKRRPNENNVSEKRLVEEYEDFLLFTTVTKVKVMCASLDYYQIPHSFLEKVLLGEKIPEEVVTEYVEGILKKKRNHEDLSSKEIKILRFIFNKQRYRQRAEVADLLKVQTVYQQIDKLVSKYEVSRDPLDYNRLVFFLKSNNDYITVYMLDRLKKLGITFSQEFEKMIKNLGEYSCIKEKKLAEKRKLQNSLERFVYDNKRRPARGSELDSIYRKKLARMPKSEIREYLKIFEKNHVRYSVEEKVLLEINNKDEVVKYLMSLDAMVANKGYKLDELDKRVLSKLKKSDYLSDFPRLDSLLPDYYQQVTIEDSIVRQIELQVINDPNREIDFNKYALSVSDKKLAKLEERRMNILIGRFFREILILMTKKKVPVNSLLNESDLETFESYKEYTRMDKDNSNLLEEIKAKEEYYSSVEKHINKEVFVSNYVDFIRDHDGERPNYASDILEERELAIMYESMRECLSHADIVLIEGAIKECGKYDVVDFYNQFIEFINKEGRMPCGNSNDPYEVKLNNLYLNLNKQFTKEQNNEVKKLRKTYSKATMQATVEFKKGKGKV